LRQHRLGQRAIELALTGAQATALMLTAIDTVQP
jgi:hypothetical protein